MMIEQKQKQLFNKLIFICLALFAQASYAGQNDIAMDEQVQQVSYKPHYFRPDPTYPDFYDPRPELLTTYEGKIELDTPRPWLELGKQMYGFGELPPEGHSWGRLNPTSEQLLLYGDLKMVYGVNRNEKDVKNNLLIWDLKFDLDYHITATERIHVNVSALQDGNNLTRVNFRGNDEGIIIEDDVTFNALFFEGDLGRIIAGFSGKYNKLDLPFTFGIIPLLFQNGVWVNDNFIGAAFTIPARNSKKLAISNLDITFFGAIDDVTSPAFTDRNGALVNKSGKILGVTTFIEANTGYWEAGIARVFSDFDDLDYFSATAAFTKRYGRISNSIRVIGAFSQDPVDTRFRTAGGVLVLLENSYITDKPLTLVPYLNLFAGFGRPQAAASTNGVGMLKNTGITFETDAQTGFPKLDDTGADTYGGAIGIEYLFDLNQQIDVELAVLFPHGPEVSSTFGPRPARGRQVAAGFRYQLPLNEQWIFRVDGTVGHLDKNAKGNGQVIAGIRTEIRLKI